MKTKIFGFVLFLLVLVIIYYFSGIGKNEYKINQKPDSNKSAVTEEVDFADSMMNGKTNEVETGNASIQNEKNKNSAIDTTAKHLNRKIVVYYFHATARCAACINIENYTQEVVETKFKKELKDKKIYFKAINFETSSNEHIIEDYKLTSSSVIIALYEGKKRKIWKNLEEVWDLEKDKDKFFSYEINEIKQYLKKLNEETT